MRSSGPVTAIDLDGKVLRVAQALRRGDQPEIVRLATQALERSVVPQDSDAEAAGQGIAQALDELKLKAKSAAMGLPRSQVFLRTLTLPAAGTVEELAAMVQFQISKDLPFRPDEAVIDFTVQRALAPAPTTQSDAREASAIEPETSEAAAKLEVLTAVVKKDVVEHYLRVAAAGRFKLAALGLRAEANARSVHATAGCEDNRALALISLRPDEVTIEIIADDALAFSRVASASLPNPAPDAGGDSLIQSVTTELVRSLHSFEGVRSDRPVGRILVAGDTGQESALAEALSRRFSLPAAILDLAEVLGAHSGENGSSGGAAAAVGLALGIQDAEGLPFDFLHPKRPPAPRNWARIKLVAGASLSAVLLLGLTGLRAHWIRQRLQIKEQIQTQVTQAEKNRALFRAMSLRAKTVREWRSEKRNWLDHYANLSALLPTSPDVYITSLSTGARGVIHLAAQARSGEILAQMDKRLREAGYQVKPLAVTPGTDRYGYSFRSSVELGLPEKMKLDLANLEAPSPREDGGSLEQTGQAPGTSSEKPSASAQASSPSGRRSRKTKP